jgi:hypothetical protein
MDLLAIAFNTHTVFSASSAGWNKIVPAVDLDHADHATGRGLIPLKEAHCGDFDSELPGGIKNCGAVINSHFTIVHE